MDFGWEEPFAVDVEVLNSRQAVHGMSELLPHASRFLRENADEGCPQYLNKLDIGHNRRLQCRT